MNCIKYTMFFFNLLTFLAGAALIGTGIWAAVTGSVINNIVPDQALATNATYVIIAVGAAIFLIGFLGCCGAVNENRCLLGTFFTLVLILFIVQIVGAVLVIVYRAPVENAAAQSLKNVQNNTNTRNVWNEFQYQFKCCGMDGPGDWDVIPDGCYPDRNTQKAVFAEGCKARIAGLFWIVAGTALGILVIELLAMIFACCLYRTIGESKGYA